ncbi:hypothetical protein OVS_04260 [Mycoplasma ovis str. Michigan]|uniref:Lipoprotein n=1 Tax=Mycoplasma ovis str. Michigan TaxID=1415773 RepID=A0ABN4BRP3_9MOLU|nr:hypothetical protein [Mycoplasma ovis]AHC40579.1 hypothetical protein OVS_04260 [Mycoplasma ovis str. Michigan]
MPAGLKIFSAILAIGGCCAGIPIYFSQTQNTVSSKAQPKTLKIAEPQPDQIITRESGEQVVSSGAGKGEEKGSCKLTSLLKEWEDFLSGRDKNKENYVAVDCKNSTKNEHSSLSEYWQGLFPKIFLKEEVLKGSLKDFEIDTHYEQVESITHRKSKYIMTFNGSGLKTTISGTWEPLLDQTQIPNKRVDSVSIDSGGLGKGEVYLLLPLPEWFLNSSGSA